MQRLIADGNMSIRFAGWCRWPGTVWVQRCHPRRLADDAATGAAATKQGAGCCSAQRCDQQGQSPAFGHRHNRLTRRRPGRRDCQGRVEGRRVIDTHPARADRQARPAGQGVGIRQLKDAGGDRRAAAVTVAPAKDQRARALLDQAPGAADGPRVPRTCSPR